jgi:hypothetical protein
MNKEFARVVLCYLERIEEILDTMIAEHDADKAWRKRRARQIDAERTM